MGLLGEDSHNLKKGDLHIVHCHSKGMCVVTLAAARQCQNAMQIRSPGVGTGEEVHSDPLDLPDSTNTGGVAER